VKFIVDNQLPVTLAEHLRDRGLDCQHVVEAGLGDATDSAICRPPNFKMASSSAKMKTSFTSPSSATPNQTHLDPPWQLSYFSTPRRFRAFLPKNRVPA
jgi:hypothetical protein